MLLCRHQPRDREVERLHHHRQLMLVGQRPHDCVIAFTECVFLGSQNRHADCQFAIPPDFLRRLVPELFGNLAQPSPLEIVLFQGPLAAFGQGDGQRQWLAFDEAKQHAAVLLGFEESGGHPNRACTFSNRRRPGMAALPMSFMLAFNPAILAATASSFNISSSRGTASKSVTS